MSDDEVLVDEFDGVNTFDPPFDPPDDIAEAAASEISAPVLLGPPSGAASAPLGIPSSGQVPQFTRRKPQFTEDAKLDPAYAREYSRVSEPSDIFQITLRPDMYPPDGFIPQYLDWVEPTTDAPRAFHLATALATLATALGRSWRVLHSSRLYGNLFVLLVSDSGGRKSTAMKIHARLLQLSLRWAGKPESTRKFMENFSSASQKIWYFDEAADFFDMINAKQATMEIKNKLTTIYDGEPTSYESGAAGMIQVQDPFLSILMGAPLAWLREKGLTADFLRGGVFARFLIVPAARDRKLLDPPQLDPAIQEELTSWLDTLVKLQGPFVLELGYEAQQEFLAWESARGELPELRLSGAWDRAGEFVKKLALLYHVSVHRGAEMKIQRDSMLQAINFVHDYALPGHLWATRRLVQVSPFQAGILTLREHVDAVPGGLRYTDLPHDLGVPVEMVSKMLLPLWRAHKIGFWKWRPGGAEQKRNNGAIILMTRYGIRPVGRPGYLNPMELPRALLKYATALGAEDEAADAFEPELDDFDPGS